MGETRKEARREQKAAQGAEVHLRQKRMVEAPEINAPQGYAKGMGISRIDASRMWTLCPDTECEAQDHRL
jgi:hypothetical protein